MVLSIRLRILSTLMLVSRPSAAVAPTVLNFFTTTGLTMPSATSVINTGSDYDITEIMSVIALLSIFVLTVVLALLYLSMSGMLNVEILIGPTQKFTCN